MKTLYIDCFSGISGDMFIGALLDAGAEPDVLVKELKKLHFEDEYELSWKKIVKNGITGTKFDVILTQNHSHQEHELHHQDGRPHEHNHVHIEVHEHDHTHDHDRQHNHEHHHDKDHHHEYEHHHEHDDPNDNHHEHDHGHDHHHRSYSDIVKMIESSELPAEVKADSLKIFRKIGEAEGHIHGLPLEKVHFHEVGAVDSIIDIVGAAILIHHLGIKKIKSSAIPVGSGRIRIEHGIYPVPAPATLEILKGVPIEQTKVRFELTTPTGAAIAAVLAEEFCTIPSMEVQSIGYGAGTKTFPDQPNVLRVIIGE